jgi:hypothetical protein
VLLLANGGWATRCPQTGPLAMSIRLAGLTHDMTLPDWVVGQPPPVVYLLSSPCDPDVNQDGNVDQDDVVYLVDVISGAPNPTGIDPDFNQDGNADQDDVTALIDVVGGGPCP